MRIGYIPVVVGLAAGLDSIVAVSVPQQLVQRSLTPVATASEVRVLWVWLDLYRACVSI